MQRGDNMTTGQEVFELTMSLIDEIEETGSVNETNTKGYKAKTPGILTVLQSELAKKEGLNMPPIITDLNNDLVVSDHTARVIMPYGLAANLMLNENPDLAIYCNSKYEEVKGKIKTIPHKITDVYNIGYDGA